MSRSYGKAAKGYPMERSWHKTLRAHERLAIHREMTGADYGDVVFPIPREVSDPYSGDCYTQALVFKEVIRDEYFKDIRGILNRRIQIFSGCEDTFIEEFHMIKGLIPDDEREFRYEWLKLKAVRRVIKAWEGEPLEVLRYLTHKGFIEQAVRREFKMAVSK
jgi:hypothetical protein